MNVPRTLALVALTLSSPAMADGLPDGDAAALVAGWANTVATGDASAVAAVLAPEFQIVRGNGARHDATAYAAGQFPKITSIPEAVEIVETTSPDLRVISYVLLVTETVDGKVLEHRAPRLTVFRRIGEGWFVAAHANFALPEG
ncbi:nuclear transport factor 2 family protein [Chachezhania sediminis]|uniref:nuclear transport factor 2 family protein n=1 Tax=Chachezhania sediminis TaxID=2599291 RepID=UPI00131E6C7D|nr:nuclear transport factor 2 family protein [Chachezhania sediminis]